MAGVTGLGHLTLLGVSPPDLVTVAAAGRLRRRWTAHLAGHRRRAAVADRARLARCWPRPSLPLRGHRDQRARRGGGQARTGAGRISRPSSTRRLSSAPGTSTRSARTPTWAGSPIEFAALVAAALPYGIRPVVEFMAYRSVRTLADATAIAAEVRRRRHPDRRAACPAVRGAAWTRSAHLIPRCQLRPAVRRAAGRAAADQVTRGAFGAAAPGRRGTPDRGSCLPRCPAGFRSRSRPRRRVRPDHPASFAARARRALESSSHSVKGAAIVSSTARGPRSGEALRRGAGAAGRIAARRRRRSTRPRRRQRGG